MQTTKQEVRNRLLNSAIEEFEEKGFEKASLRRIVKSANSSLGNLYKYFKNKEALFNAIINPIVEECYSNILKINPLITDSHTIATQLIDFFENNKTVFNILIKGTHLRYEKFLNGFAGVSQDIIKKYVDSVLKNSNKIDSNIYLLLAELFINGMRVIIERYETKEKAIDEIQQLLIILFKDIDKRLI